MTYKEQSQIALRDENFDRLVKSIAIPDFIAKNLCMITRTNSWLNYHYRESIRALNSVAGIPRGAAFPQDNLEWEKQTLRIKKFGLEIPVTKEDLMTDVIDIAKRCGARIAHAISKDMDTAIWTVLTESYTPANINTTAIAATTTWNHVTRSQRHPLEDIATAKAQCSNSTLQSYVPDTLVINPTDSIYLLTNDDVRADFSNRGPEVTLTGQIGRLLGLDYIESSQFTTDYCMILKRKTAATYYEAEALQAAIVDEPGIGKIFRGWELGGAILTDPKAISLLTNTLT